MSTKQSKLTSQGQVSVPASVRQFLSLSPGGAMLWVQEGERMWVQRAVTHTPSDAYQALFGNSAPKRAIDTQDTKQAIRSFIQKKHARH